MTQGKKPFENIVGKGENAGNQYFLLFPQCFPLFSKQILIHVILGYIYCVYCKCYEFGQVLQFVIWYSYPYLSIYSRPFQIKSICTPDI